MILVTGATGTQARRWCGRCWSRTEEVRAFVRDPEKARDRCFGDAAELAVGDFADPQSVRAALRRRGGECSSRAPTIRAASSGRSAAIDAAAAQGVRRIVKLSSIMAGPGRRSRSGTGTAGSRSHLRQSRVPAVVLRSSFFMSNLLAAAEQVAREGRLYAPAAGARIAMIDPRDVGAAAAAVLTTHGGS